MGAELAEQGIRYAIPNGTGTPEWKNCEGEIQVVEFPDGVIEVRDPLFEVPYRFGDQSLVKDVATDRIIVEAWQHFTYMMDSRQMAQTERHETQHGGGRMSRMPHMLQCAALTAMYDGTAREILTQATHDVPHRIWGHPVDSALRQLGPHTAHDFDQPGFFRRSGFVARLQAKGLCDEDGMLANGVHINDLTVREDDGSGILSHSTQSRLLDLDRWGYNLMQELTVPGGIERAREQFASVRRVNDPVHGDQLVFDSVTQAEEFALRQADRWYRYWASPENLTVNHLLQMLIRHVLTVNPVEQPLAAPYQQYFPGDTLRGLAVDWQDIVTEMSKTDHGVSGLLKIMDAFTAHVRRYNAGRDVHAPYEGPGFPLWAHMHTNTQKLVDTAPRFVPGKTAATDWLVLYSNAGKERLVNPFVEVDGELQRLYDASPGIKEQIDRDSRWAREGFSLVIDLGGKDLGLTFAERRAIKDMTSRAAAESWAKALLRDEMSPEMLQVHIEAWNRRYRSIGALSVERVVELAA